MELSRFNFELKNKVLQSRPIVNRAIDVDLSGGLVKADFIDLNRDGLLDKTYRPSGLHGCNSRSERTEPVLSQSMAELKQRAAKLGQEVLTQDALGGQLEGHMLEKREDTNGPYEQLHVAEHGGHRPLNTVAQQIGSPADGDLKWAIDTQNSEFLVYTPR